MLHLKILHSRKDLPRSSATFQPHLGTSHVPVGRDRIFMTSPCFKPQAALTSCEDLLLDCWHCSSSLRKAGRKGAIPQVNIVLHLPHLPDKNTTDYYFPFRKNPVAKVILPRCYHKFLLEVKPFPSVWAAFQYLLRINGRRRKWSLAKKPDASVR